jgi:hypothetical protein
MHQDKIITQQEYKVKDQMKNGMGKIQNIKEYQISG